MQLPDFRPARILVAGDLMLDRYWYGGTSRISPEAPVPVVLVNGAEERAGGAGNVALNIVSLGAKATLLGYCGQDEAADTLIRILRNAGIHCLPEPLADAATITKLRIISRHQQLIRLDFEDRFHKVQADGLLARFAAELEQASVVVLSDYDKGSLNSADQLIDLCCAAGKPVLVDPKGADFSKYRRASIITPNLVEFEAVVGTCRTEAELVGKGQTLMADLELEALLITRGEHGMTLLSHADPPLHLAAHAKEVFDVTGAGDTVIAVLAAGLAVGMPLAEATALANLAAGLVVGKLGAASVTTGELTYALHGQRAHQRGVFDLDAFLEVLSAARWKGEKIVATNGCFDLLHPGHIHYLQQAKQLGDRLVVLLNSDASVRRLKGDGRPINPLEHRAAMLGALECVDWVVPFDADTPEESIRRIRPDVLVKGGDYRSVSDVAGHECVLAQGGEVKILGYVDGFSTTGLIQTIRNQ
jgi:D-beta-D-heptose 7-phosphate kinase/D-beta-D-heptose 1-phosphate adenosyltransferase